MSKNCFRHEQNYIQRGYDFVIGIDEAGRGPLAGPIVAAAAAMKHHSEFRSRQNKKSFTKRIGEKQKRSFASTWVEAQDDDYLKLVEAKNDERFHLIRDSKLLSEKQREELYDYIFEHFYVGVGMCDHKTIDRINILQATYLAMKKAIADLTRKSKIHLTPTLSLSGRGGMILVDGNKIIPNCSYQQQAIIGGDKIVKSISAASIIAKVTRDRIMRKMDKKYPKYHFAKHKGYGTELHRELIEKHGLCQIHRKSFKLL